MTYNELFEKTSLLAGALAELGVRKGDKVIIYMPLIPETIIAILATTRLGAVHSVVFGGNNDTMSVSTRWIINTLSSTSSNLDDAWVPSVLPHLFVGGTILLVWLEMIKNIFY